MRFLSTFERQAMRDAPLPPPSRALAVVTGANKGIGFSCAERLCEALGENATVVLTARNADLGMYAVDELKKKGHSCVEFHQLDVSDEKSVDALAAFVSERGGCDILINNAGIAFKISSPEPFGVQARQTIDVNYHGTKRCMEKFLPLMKQGGRIVQVSSQSGQVCHLPWPSSA